MNAPELQYAALPYRWSRPDGLEVMLITSRDTGRWVIPKGWPIEGLTPPESAAREALEEGGLVGRIGERQIGVYHYDKSLDCDCEVRCVVEMFALEVEQQLETWQEHDQRQTRWFDVTKAAAAVEEPELSAIIRSLAALLS